MNHELLGFPYPSNIRKGNASSDFHAKMFCATDELRWHVIMYCCIADDNLAPSTEYYEEIATVTQFLSEIQPSTNIAVFFILLHKHLNLHLLLHSRSVTQF